MENFFSITKRIVVKHCASNQESRLLGGKLERTHRSTKQLLAANCHYSSYVVLAPNATIRICPPECFRLLNCVHTLEFSGFVISPPNCTSPVYISLINTHINAHLVHNYRTPYIFQGHFNSFHNSWAVLSLEAWVCWHCGWCRPTATRVNMVTARLQTKVNDFASFRGNISKCVFLDEIIDDKSTPGNGFAPNMRQFITRANDEKVYWHIMRQHMPQLPNFCIKSGRYHRHRNSGK